MPINRMYPFQEVFELLDKHLARTGRRVWIAYVLIKGKYSFKVDINDTVDHAQALGNFIRSRPGDVRHLYHVNLIPYNKGIIVFNIVQGDCMERVLVDGAKAFEKELNKLSISTSYRFD